MTDVATLRVPPHNLDAEQAVIAAVLITPTAIADIELQAEAFYRREHRAIWQAILELAGKRAQFDVVAVADQLRSVNQLAEAGGIEYLSELIGSSQSAANVATYAEIVAGKAAQRRMCALAHELADIGYNDGETLDKINRAQAAIADFQNGLQVGANDQARSLDECMRETITTLQRNWDNQGQLLGMPTGYNDLDKRLHGMRRGDMIVIAGRPSQGKTTLAMNIAENVALAGGFVIVFSLEMPREALSMRMVSSQSRVAHEKVQNGQLDDDEINRVQSAMAKLKGRAMWIDDRSSVTSDMLLSRARRIAHKVGRKPDLVVVDYLQQLADKGDEGDGRITRISRNCKSLARELDCPALILAQLNRGVEGRPDKRPLMSDLRGSGSIEQDADIILMMYRDEYYDENSMAKGLAEVICRKYRNGQIGTDILAANLHICRFDNSQVRHIQQAVAKKSRGFKHYAD